MVGVIICRWLASVSPPRYVTPGSVCLMKNCDTVHMQPAAVLYGRRARQQPLRPVQRSSIFGALAEISSVNVCGENFL